VLVLFAEKITHAHHDIDLFRVESRQQIAPNRFRVYRARSMQFLSAEFGKHDENSVPVRIATLNPGRSPPEAEEGEHTSANQDLYTRALHMHRRAGVMAPGERAAPSGADYRLPAVFLNLQAIGTLEWLSSRCRHLAQTREGVVDTAGVPRSLGA
jgi:hypothetical protein